MISLNRFFFRGKSSIDFDLLTELAFDGDSGSTETFLNRDAVSSSVYDGSRVNVHNFKYTENLNVKLTLIKNDFSDFNEFENRKILSWLTGSTKVEKMVCYKDDSEVVAFVLMGNITQIEQRKMGNGRVVGYDITFFHIAPYAYSPVRIVTKTVVEPKTFVINCYTDVYEKHLYPQVEITIADIGEDGVSCLPVIEDPMADGYDMFNNTIYKYENAYYTKVNNQKRQIQIFKGKIEDKSIDETTYGKYYCATYDRCIYGCILQADTSLYTWQKFGKIGAAFEIKNTYYEDGKDVVVSAIVTDNYENEVITINGDNRVISSSATPMRIIGDTFNWVWPYFVPGENHITISGNCTVTFQWVEPIKIGNV